MAGCFVLALAAGTQTAQAGWGCAYNSSAGIGRQWGHPSEEEARRAALNACTSRNFKNCRIIGCAVNVNSKEDADKIWARTPGIKYTCGPKGKEGKC